MVTRDHLSRYISNEDKKNKIIEDCYSKNNEHLKTINSLLAENENLRQQNQKLQTNMFEVSTRNEIQVEQLIQENRNQNEIIKHLQKGNSTKIQLQDPTKIKKKEFLLRMWRPE